MTTERWSRPALLVPGLVAAFPATFLWSANFDEIPPLDAWITIGLFMLVGVLVQLAVVLGTRRRRMASSTTSAIASLLNAILFFIVLAAERLPLRFRYGVMLLGGLLTIGIVRLWQKGGHRPGIARALTLMAFASYASLLVRPGLERFERRALRERLRNVPSLTGPISGPATGTSRPDIYLIVLDTYGGPEVLRTVYGADDRPFRDSLRALGFTLPVTRSNYPITAMSLASLLNAAYLDSLGPVLDGHPPALWPYYDLIHRDRLTRFLGSRGYRSYVVPSVPWIGTLVHERAAIHLTTARLGMVAGARLRSVLLFTTWPHTLVGQLWPDAVRWSTPGNVMAAFEGTRELIGRPGPKFVLTHSMAAHFPFSVDRDCGPLPSAIGDPELATDRARVAYVDGILCTDRAVLSLVTEILRRSPTPPVILLQGDHGPRGLGLPWLGDAATITAVQARGRFETFGAYYLPGAKRQLPDTVTPVTVVRAVLSDYFGADLPPLPDRSLHATMDHPYRFFVIPDALLRDSTPLARYGVTLEEHEHPRDP